MFEAMHKRLPLRKCVSSLFNTHSNLIDSCVDWYKAVNLHINARYIIVRGFENNIYSKPKILFAQRSMKQFSALSIIIKFIDRLKTDYFSEKKIEFYCIGDFVAFAM